MAEEEKKKENESELDIDAEDENKDGRFDKVKVRLKGHVAIAMFFVGFALGIIIGVVWL